MRIQNVDYYISLNKYKYICIYNVLVSPQLTLSNLLTDEVRSYKAMVLSSSTLCADLLAEFQVIWTSSSLVPHEFPLI